MYDKIANKLINDFHLPANIFEIDFANLKATSKDDKNTFYETKINHANDFKGHFYINHFKENYESIVLLINTSEVSPYLESINEVLTENDIEIFEEELKEPSFRNTDSVLFLGIIPNDKIFEIHLTRKTQV